MVWEVRTRSVHDTVRFVRLVLLLGCPYTYVAWDQQSKRESYTLPWTITHFPCHHIVSRFFRFPGGESYRDLIRRLLSVVIDVEQQVIPTLVVSHESILQCLIAYFRNTPVEKCMSIEVPMHSVIKFTPVRGGGWKESSVPLFSASAALSGGKDTVSHVESVSESSQSSLNYCEGVRWREAALSAKVCRDFL